MELQRSSGLLLHPTSLPGEYGIGEIGDSAYHWIDFLLESKQSVWQILPLGPTSYGDSPYQVTSVFAGNPLLIDLKSLAKSGYISPNDLKKSPDFLEDCVDFKSVIEWKMPLLEEAFNRFSEIALESDIEGFAHFCSTYDDIWLAEFALFMAIKNQFDKRAWCEWPVELKLRDADSLAEMRNQLKNEIQAQKFFQYQFFKQWTNLKNYANQQGIRILGDIPIYVSHDSADLWANQDKFCLDDEGNLLVVAGVPPDYFSETGQLWGNPIYKWDVMEKNGFRWWIERVRTTLQYVDVIRIDHFRGFEAYWEVAYGEETAINGRWVKGPGHVFFDKLMEALPQIPIIAEDLGVITPEVTALRDRYGFPGMKILQFAFSGDASNRDLPHNYNTACVVYSGNHDNNTTHGWFKTISEKEREYCIRHLGKKPKNISWDLMRLACASTADVAIYPIQDVLGLGSEARMNYPGRASGNWTWRLKPGQLSRKYTKKLAEMTEIYGRSNPVLQI